MNPDQFILGGPQGNQAHMGRGFEAGRTLDQCRNLGVLVRGHGFVRGPFEAGQAMVRNRELSSTEFDRFVTHELCEQDTLGTTQFKLALAINKSKSERERSAFVAFNEFLTDAIDKYPELPPPDKPAPRTPRNGRRSRPASCSSEESLMNPFSPTHQIC